MSGDGEDEKDGHGEFENGGGEVTEWAKEEAK